MVISHSCRLLFVHVPRTGGSSVRDLLGRIVPGSEPFLQQHDGMQRAQEELGAELPSYLSFGFVRDPWQRLASWYQLLRMQADPDETIELLDFDSYIEEGIERAELPPSQLSYLCDAGGVVRVDEWGRFENLESELRRILVTRGIEAPRLPHHNSSARPRHDELYTPALRDLVATHYAEDFEHFGYAR